MRTESDGMDDEAEPLADGSTANGLTALRFDSDEAYLIEATGDREWRARRLGDWLTADGPDGLRLLIREDYAVRPVLRDGGARR
jgi:hypothetical protein